MTAQGQVSSAELWGAIGTGRAPVVADVRLEEDRAADPRIIPTAISLPAASAASWAGRYAGRDVVVSCARGRKLSEGAAALLRLAGVRARVLEGGHEGWRAAGLPLVPLSALPPRDAEGRTLWVTRSRPKIDRIACPWLLRRFVDPGARVLFVTAAEVPGVAERFGAVPFDIEGVFWSHRGEGCTFDTMLAEFGLATPALERLATIVRGADTARPDLAPEAAGLLAVSLGLSALEADDLAQLERGLLLYDALYVWARDAGGETHNWPARQAPA